MGKRKRYICKSWQAIRR